MSKKRIHNRAGVASADAPSLRYPGFLVVLVVTLILGIGICGYLTWHHEIEVHGDKSAELGNCPQTDTINCEAVNTSEWSELWGVPIATFGIPTYLLCIYLTLMAKKRSRAIAYLFGIGLLTTVYSGFLYYVSAAKIGFLCLWCLRLYAVNLSIPVLSGLAMWRNPVQLVKDAAQDLTRWPHELQNTALVFAVLLTVTVGGQQAFRASLQPGDREDAVASEEGEKSDTASSPAPDALPFVSQNALPLVRMEGKRSVLATSPLVDVVGKGRTTALIFWMVRTPQSHAGLIEFTRFIQERGLDLDVFAVATIKEDQKLEQVAEVYQMLELPPTVTLLADPGFKVFQALKLQTVPALVLLDRSGRVISPSIGALDHTVAVVPARQTGADLLTAVAKGEAVEPLRRTGPYYPGSALFGKCAPAFTLRDFSTGKLVTFSGKSPASRPTFLMFWSSTCKHCQQEVPKIVDHMKRYSKDYDFISVTTLKPDHEGFSHRSYTEKYIKEQGIKFLVLEDPGSVVSELYRSVSTPTTYLITANGLVDTAWFYGQPDLDKAMERALFQLNRNQGTCSAVEPLEGPSVRMSVMDLLGKRVELESEIRQPTLVHYWATWCAPCRAELPTLIRFREKFEAAGGRVMLISVEDEGAIATIQQYEQREKLELKSYLAPRAGLADRVDLSYLVPRTYMLSADGRVVRSYYGEQDWMSAEAAEPILNWLRAHK